MRLFHIYYDGRRYPVFASNHESARRLGTQHLVNRLHIVEPSKIAVVDPEIAAGYKRALFTNVTEQLRQHTQEELAAAADALTGVDIFRQRRERWAGDFA